MRNLGTKKCQTCDKEFQQSYNVSVKKWETTKFCSRQCKRHTPEAKLLNSIAHRGSNHPQWKGGVKKLNERIRALGMFRDWRVDVFERDDYTCQMCNKRSCAGDRFEINADHIKPVCRIVHENKIKTIEDAISCRELWDRDNGRTLCVSCHKSVTVYHPNLTVV